MKSWKQWQRMAKGIAEKNVNFDKLDVKTTADYLNLIMAILHEHKNTKTIDKTKLPHRVRLLLDKTVFYRKDLCSDIEVEKGFIRYGKGDIADFVALGKAPKSYLKDCLVIPTDKNEQAAKSGKIRVLIVDDSPIIHKILEKIFEEAGDIETVGNAMNASEAEELRQKLKPDLMTLDIHMPGKDGLEYLEDVMKSGEPTKTILFSSISKQEAATVLRGLELGAMEYVEKPSIAKMTDLKLHIIDVVRTVHESKFRKVQKTKSAARSFITVQNPEHKLIVIGSSTGGTEALADVLATFPSNCPPTLIVQHIPQFFSSTLAQRLNTICKATVQEAQGNDNILPGNIYIAPGDFHMGIKTSGEKIITFINQDPKVNHHRPSVDFLFKETHSRIKNKDIVAVMLTGMGRDGSTEMAKLHKKGAHTIAQDEATSVVYGMPKAAVEEGGVKEVAPLDKITEKIFNYYSKSKFKP